MAETKSAAASEKKTLIEEGTRFKGSLQSTCPVVVRGSLDGDVSAPSLMVSNTGAVHGVVKVGEIRSEGEISGEFDADVVHLSGSVKDNTIIRAKSLEVKLAPKEGKLQVVFGECAMEVGDPMTREAAVNGATAGDKKKRSEPPAPAAEGE